MHIPRELIYEERNTIVDFDVLKEGTLNKLLYDEWIFKRTELKPGSTGFKERILIVLNDAYYICTQVLMQNKREFNLSYYITCTSIPEVVIPLVYIYLLKLKEKDVTFKHLLQSIETEAEIQGWQNNLKDINEIAKSQGKEIDRNMFSRRELTPEILSKIDWITVTDNYTKDGIDFVIRNIAKDEKEGKMIVDAIEKAVNKTEALFYEPCTEPIIEEEDFHDDYSDDNDFTPDYSETYRYCTELKEKDFNCIVKKNQSHETHSDKKPATFQLQKFLEGSWFDDFSPQNFSMGWRHELVIKLMETRWGDYVAKEWGKRGKRSKKIIIKCGLVGLLKDARIIQGQYKKIANQLGLNLKVETLCDYMRKKETLLDVDEFKAILQSIEEPDTSTEE